MQPDAETTILPGLRSHLDIQRLSLQELEALAAEVRREIIQTVSCTGGHLAPSLGVVELTLALLSVFDPARDRFVWDVGHQTYAYKILTQGLERFRTLRQLGGMSGFPRPSESPFDHFGVGHSSTSISSALGMAVARDLAGEEHKVLAVIGDGSMTAGLAYEGLNQSGDLDRDLVVILNDNEMSISKNVGALSSFFSRKLSDQRFIRFKEDLKSWLKQVPRIGEELVNYARRSEESLKSFFTPGMLFEAFKFNYLGPINGHSLEQLRQVFEQVRSLHGPVLVHVLTTKGKGYPPAEQNPTSFHGIGCFDPASGRRIKTADQGRPSYSAVFGQTLQRLAEHDERIVAITAAMPEGTGLGEFKSRFPDRFFDVGICEQHAVTFAAGLAMRGFRPVVSIYSTFLQRAYDQIVHDVCLQNLPVTLCLDRSGLVGEDGSTHHGAFDVSYLRHIPNMTLMAPSDEAELQSMLLTALEHSGPAAVRYPRGRGPGLELAESPEPLELGRGLLAKTGRDVLVLALGSCFQAAREAIQAVEAERDCSIGLFNPRFVAPLPESQLRSLLEDAPTWLVVEENVMSGGFGSAVLEFLAREDLLGRLRRVKRLGLPDAFVEHGTPKQLQELVGIDAEGIAAALRSLLAENAPGRPTSGAAGD